MLNISTEQVSPYAEKAFSYLDALAGKLDTTIDYLWPKMIGATRLQGIVNLLPLLIFIMLVLFAKKIWHLIGLLVDCDDASTVRVIYGLAAIFIFLLTLGGLSSALGKLFYPEYYAIQDLLKSVK